MFNGILWETMHSGKLAGMRSISTSCLVNEFCIRRKKNEDSVCSHCYADRFMKMRAGLKDHLEYNTKLLTSRILTDEELPLVSERIYRFESFGDIANETQLINYINICNYNPRTTFALWTKNYEVIREAFCDKGFRKPDNLIIILSSYLLNQPCFLTGCNDKTFIDKVFTVYEKKFAEENDVKINCGGKKCVECRLCYSKKTTGDIHELLK